LSRDGSDGQSDDEQLEFHTIWNDGIFGRSVSHSSFFRSTLSIADMTEEDDKFRARRERMEQWRKQREAERGQPTDAAPSTAPRSVSPQSQRTRDAHMTGSVSPHRPTETAVQPEKRVESKPISKWTDATLPALPAEPLMKRTRFSDAISLIIPIQLRNP
jgi:hypothetical protein